MKYSVVIVAAGSGSRMGLGYNKVYAKLNDGQTILQKSMHIFEQDSDCTQIIVVCDATDFYMQIGHVESGRVVLVQGGSTRQQSVLHGLLCAREEVVFIHDGARPFLSEDCLETLKDVMEYEAGAVLTVPCKDTIKVVRDGYIENTVERSIVYGAQTPQVFRTDILLAANMNAMRDGFEGTDDSSIVERYSDIRIRSVPGDYGNRKITTPEDLM